MVSRIEPRSNALQSAGHAVLRTLYSRALRIGLNEASWLLRDLRKNVSSDLLLVDVARVLAKPALELGIPLEQELERFTDDVGCTCADELGVSVQVVSDFFLQANLKGCSLWLFGWCFQQWQLSSSFSHSPCNTACTTNYRLRSLHADKTRPRAARGRAGATPRPFGRLKAAQGGVAPARFDVLSACRCHLFHLRIRRSLKSLWLACG